MARRRSATRSCAEALVAAVGVLAASPAGAQEPPSASLDRFQWLGRDTVTVSGTGCLDPDTGSSEGLGVLTVLDPGEDEQVIHALTAVASDGDFDVRAQVPYIGPVPRSLEPRCVRLDDPDTVVVRYAPIAVRSVPDPAATQRLIEIPDPLPLDGTFVLPSPCSRTVESISVWFFGPTESPQTSYGLSRVDGPFEPGQPATIPIDSHNGPGTYGLRVECYTPVPPGFTNAIADEQGNEPTEEHVDEAVEISAQAALPRTGIGLAAVAAGGVVLLLTGCALERRFTAG